MKYSLKVHFLPAGFECYRTACGRVAYRDRGRPSEASTPAGNRIDVTDDRRKVTCDKCSDTQKMKR